MSDHSIQERFWKRVNKNGPVPAHCPHLGPCWLWAGSGDGRYGSVSVNGRVVKAHRVSFELQFGEIPAGLMVLHHCDNPACVRPSHLFSGTQSDNLKDCASKGRSGAHTKPERLARGDRNGSRTHPESLARGERNGAVKAMKDTCRRGHLYTVRPNGIRVCQVCVNIKQNERRKEKGR